MIHGPQSSYCGCSPPIVTTTAVALRGEVDRRNPPPSPEPDWKARAEKAEGLHELDHKLADQYLARAEVAEARREALLDLAAEAWTVIANAEGGNWKRGNPEWQEAAVIWRDRYDAALAAPPTTPAPVAQPGVVLTAAEAEQVREALQPAEIRVTQPHADGHRRDCAGCIEVDAQLAANKERVAAALALLKKPATEDRPAWGCASCFSGGLHNISDCGQVIAVAERVREACAQACEREAARLEGPFRAVASGCAVFVRAVNLGALLKEPADG